MENRVYVVYICGPISNGGSEMVEAKFKANIEKARREAINVYEKLANLTDVYVICPHLNAPWLGLNMELTKSILNTIFGDRVHNDVLKLDIKFIKKCVDIVYALEGHELSQGCQMEIEAAKQFGIPVVTSISDIVEILTRRKNVKQIKESN